MTVKKFPCGCTWEVVGKSPDGHLLFDYDPNKAPLDCPGVWNMVSDGKTLGGFQITTKLGQSNAAKVKPRNIEELSDLVSIIRPNCLDAFIDGKNLTNHYIDRKTGKEEGAPLHSALSDITKNTQFLMIYQETVLQAAKILAGFTPVEARKLQKAMGKKLPEIMVKVKKDFIEGCLKVGTLNQEEAEKVFDIIEANQRYSFNKCLSPDTKVFKENIGEIKICNLSIGDNILGPDGKYTKVVNIYHNGNHDLYKFTTKNGLSIKCTLDHKFYCVLNDDSFYGMVSAKDCFTGRNLIKTASGSSKFMKAKYIGYHPTMDIEVDNYDHIFLANDLMTSNSHAVGYSVNSYLYSLYPKYHFPDVFFTSQLQYLNNLDEAEEFIDDAKNFNVVVKKPDLREKNVKFIIKNGNIIFGLGSIKHVGESAVKALLDALDDFKLEGASWTGFLLKTALAVNSGALKAIIQSGAVDFLMETRSRMLFELDIFHKLSNNQQQFLIKSPPVSLKQGVIDIIKLGSGKFCPCKTVKSLEKLQIILKTIENPPFSLQDSYRGIAQMERENLGYEFSCTELDSCDMLSFATHSCEELIKAAPSKRIIRVPALIKRVAKHKSANGEMAFIEFRDSTASINFGVCFASDWERLQNTLYENNKVILSGFKSANEGRSASFLIGEVYQI